MKPTISVIMSIYNPTNEKVVIESIRSILNQTFKDFEFIIYNDGSTSKNIDRFMNDICALDSRIIIISSNKNRGLAYGRNRCLEKARGKYIALHDDDDISEKTRLEKELDFLKKNSNYQFVGCQGKVIDINNKEWGEYLVPREPVKKDFLWNSPFLNPSVMFRADILKKMGGYRVAPETRRAEDYDLYFRLYAKGYKGYNLPEKLFQYRIVIIKNKKYRPLKSRLEEAIVRAKGYKRLNMLVLGMPFVIKPIVIGLLPANLFNKIRKYRYKRK